MGTVIAILLTVIAFFAAYQAQTYWLWDSTAVIVLYTIAGWLSGITTIVFFMELSQEANRIVEKRKGP